MVLDLPTHRFACPWKKIHPSYRKQIYVGSFELPAVSSSVLNTHSLWQKQIFFLLQRNHSKFLETLWMEGKRRPYFKRFPGIMWRIQFCRGASPIAHRIFTNCLRFSGEEHKSLPIYFPEWKQPPKWPSSHLASMKRNCSLIARFSRYFWMAL